MCVIHSQDGTIKQEFRGENCNKQLLEFVPDGAIIYFHNLAYDIRMVASLVSIGQLPKVINSLKQISIITEKQLHLKIHYQ